MAKVTGLGGVFFKSPDPVALGRWYEMHLGMTIHADVNCAMLATDKRSRAAFAVWSPFAEDTNYFEPSSRDFMVNLVVDDLEGALAQVAAAGATVHGEPQTTEFGRYGWFTDPDGNKVELWQPDGDEGGDG